MNYKFGLKWQLLVLFPFLLIIILIGPSIDQGLYSGAATTSSPIRQVNIPHSGDEPDVQPAIFWFGQVSPTSNYADVRSSYNDQKLKITVHIFDRQLWYDESPDQNELTAWDSVSLFLNINDNGSTTPTLYSFRFDAQLNHFQSRDNYQSAFRGDGADWSTSNILFSTKTGWRGNGLNNYQEDRGWRVSFTIPFSSLDLNSVPTKSTSWRMSLSVHDRDDANGSSIPDEVWPESADPISPVSWGFLHFGLPVYQRLPASPEPTSNIRHGLNGAIVIDGHVGGHSACGAPFHPDYFSSWGEATYYGYDQINIQNQWDVSDWPCFSKYFVTFPLGSFPSGFVVVSATLSMTLFGNAGGGEWGEPPDSFIQVLTVGEDWNENTLNWNNAPLAQENISGTWVKPTQTSDQREYFWDVSKAVMDSYQFGGPVRLALYSADGERHTGKYFWSSDVGEWGAEMRPALEVVLGTPCDSPEVECILRFLPLIRD